MLGRAGKKISKGLVGMSTRGGGSCILKACFRWLGFSKSGQRDLALVL